MPPKAGADLEVGQYGILFPVGSVESLVKALRRLLNNAELKGRLAKDGPSRAKEFSVELSMAAYERLLFPDH